MASLMQLIAYGLQDLPFPITEEGQFYSACDYGNSKVILELSNVQRLTHNNSYAFKRICSNANVDTLAVIVEKFRSKLDLLPGLYNTCEYGNYDNFLYLLNCIDSSHIDLFYLLICTVKGCEIFNYKKTRVFDIYRYLIDKVITPDYIKLLEENIQKRFSSFEIFEDLMSKLEITNSVELFKSACLAGCVEKAKYIYEKFPSEIETFVNSSLDSEFIIKVFSNDFCYNCAKLICKINKRKNYSVVLTESVDAYGCYGVTSYRIKDNEGNIIKEYVCEENDNIVDFDNPDDEYDDDEN